MAKTNKSKKRPIEQYEHKDKERLNNPPVGLVTPETDPDVKMGQPKKKYEYDPHLDPQLVWAGKAEHTSFEIPTVSLHVHERIDPRSIVEAVRKKNGSNYEQMSLFASKEENPPLRDAIDFYKHRHNWSNRLIAGDRLLVMNSLLEKEGLGGQVQSIYFDPPYGIKYGSNFQPFVNKRDVKDGKDEDLTAEPEMIKAFRDTWELGIHSYLTYIRDTLLLSRELLTESGSMFVQISDENVHLVRNILDEVFLPKNFCSQITFRTATSQPSNLIPSVADVLLWYAKDVEKVKYRALYRPRSIRERVSTFGWIELTEGSSRSLTTPERIGKAPLPEGKLFKDANITESTEPGEKVSPVSFSGKKYELPKGLKYWDNIDKLIRTNRIVVIGDRLCGKRYEDDSTGVKYTNIWDDTIQGTFELTKDPKRFVVQTNPKVIARCLLMTTDPGDLVFDPTCGSGTTAYVAEQWGRRWITCDTSRVATTLAKQRLMTSVFDYYELAHPEEGVGSGFLYKTVPHVTLKSIANNEPPSQETLYDQPRTDNKRTRVTGPFTVEAVPAPVVRPLTPVSFPNAFVGNPEGSHALDSRLQHAGKTEWAVGADMSIARSGETLRHSEWRAELLKSGIRGKNGQYILFSRVEPLAGTRWLHAEAETKPNDRGADSVKEVMPGYGKPQRVVISFGPEHAPLEQRQVELAWEEARSLVPRPAIVVFAAFQFDPEAAKDIDELDPKKVGMILLKAQMNADLLTDDLKKKRTSSDSFWLMGQPDVRLKRVTLSGAKSLKARGKSDSSSRRKDVGTPNDRTLYQIEVLGFDYYNTKTGTIESGGTERIALWMLDTDYDGRSLFARQVFFPMAGENEGWSRLARNLKAEIDEELIEAYRGTVSLPFEAGKNKRVAVKIVDDRGIESLKVIEVE
jgi:adenine-specific DNA-methyltransferase